MVRQAQTKTLERNPDLPVQSRRQGEDNLAWGMRAVKDMVTAGPDTWTYIALLGAVDTVAFRLRVAQSVLRRDMLPSYWSEAILVKLKTASLQNAEAIHVPLVQPAGAAFAPYENGVVSCPLETFRDAEVYPKIALIALPVAQEKMVKRVDDFRRARATIDALEHVLRWLAFAWGVARTGNPLHENYGIPSACMLETVCAAEGYDLTPGLESRASCPEAIWGAATYWYDYYAKAGGDKDRKPQGRYAIGHTYSIDGGTESGGESRAQRNAATGAKRPRGRASKKTRR